MVAIRYLRIIAFAQGRYRECAIQEEDVSEANLKDSLALIAWEKIHFNTASNSTYYNSVGD